LTVGWQQVDLSKIDATQRKWPSVGRCASATDGVPTHIFYAGAINMLFGESAAGKTWIALAIVKQEIEAGHHVVYIDFESASQSIAERLASFGLVNVGPSKLTYIEAEGPLSNEFRDALDAHLDKHKPTLMVIDSVGEAMSAEGLQGERDDEIIKWRAALSGHFAKKGLCVIEIDHVGVSWMNGGKTRALGGQRKRAGLSGISVLAQVVKGHEHVRGKTGRTKLTCTKDREGAYQQGKTFAIFEHCDDVYGKNGSVSFRPATDEDLAPSAPDEPAFMKIARAIQDNGVDQSLSIRKTVETLAALGIKTSRDTVTSALGHLNGESRLRVVSDP
jgi:RecA/RadA recombinase